MHLLSTGGYAMHLSTRPNIKQYTTVNMMLAAINIGFFPYFLDHLTTKGNKHSATPIAQSMTKNDCDSLTFNRTVI